MIIMWAPGSCQSMALQLVCACTYLHLHKH